MTYQCYVILPCENIKEISSSIYNFLETQTDILHTTQFGWHFVDLQALLKHTPKLFDFFRENKLIPRHAAITIVETNNHLPKHIDEPPVIAKVNIPVSNTEHWANRWYVNDQMVSELVGMNQPVVFNSQISHSVEMLEGAGIPRIVASFTFHNEPLDYLK
jgi:hypothetical protein